MIYDIWYMIYDIWYDMLTTEWLHVFDFHRCATQHSDGDPRAELDADPGPGGWSLALSQGEANLG